MTHFPRVIAEEKLCWCENTGTNQTLPEVPAPPCTYTLQGQSSPHLWTFSTFTWMLNLSEQKEGHEGRRFFFFFVKPERYKLMWLKSKDYNKTKHLSLRLCEVCRSVLQTLSTGAKETTYGEQAVIHISVTATFIRCDSDHFIILFQKLPTHTHVLCVITGLLLCSRVDRSEKRLCLCVDALNRGHAP